MADGYADDGLDWYRQLIAGGANDPSGSAGNLPGSGPSGYPQASGSGPYMGYRAQQNPFPQSTALSSAKPPGSGWSIAQLLGINSANAAEPQLAPQSTPGTTLTSNPLETQAPLSISSEFPHLASTPAQPQPSISSEFPHLGNQPLRAPAAAPETAPAPTAAPSALSGGLGAVAPASTLLSGVASGNKGVQQILKQAHPEWSDADMREWLKQQVPQTGGAPPSSSTGPSIPTPFINAGTDPTTLTRSSGERPPPVPPTMFGDPPLPPNRPPPIVQAPIPVGMPHLGGHPAHAGAARQQPVGALGDPNATGGAAPPSPGEYFATTGNARGASWTPGGFASPPAQHFQTPLTPMFGPGQWIGGPQPAAPGPAAPQVVGRGAPQGGYNVGGMFANLPNNTFDNSQGGAVAPTRVARAPVIQRRSVAGYPLGTGYAGGL